MIELPVDEAYALDYLAILFVKRLKALNVTKELHLVGHALSTQLPNLERIVASSEFQRLVKANRTTFDAVAQSGMTPVQIANYERFKAKKALQRRFFPHKPITEKKRKGGI